MPVYTQVIVQCDDCGHEPTYGGDSREHQDPRASAISFARSEGFSVTDRGVFCGGNGRCRFDQRWAEYRARRNR